MIKKLHCSNKQWIDIKFGISKVSSCLRFFDKKAQKKIVVFHVFINQFNLARKHNKTFFCFFFSSYVIKFLEVLKRGHFIFNFQAVPAQYFSPFLLFSTFPAFLERVGMVVFNYSRLYGDAVSVIQPISRPGRYIYVSHAQLKKLTSGRRHSITSVFVINTIYGILFHAEALRLGIGGNLICVLK